VAVIPSEHGLQDGDTLAVIEVFSSEEVEEDLTSVALGIVGDGVESSQLLNKGRGSVSSVIEPSVGEVIGLARFDGLSSGLTFSNKLLVEGKALWLGHSPLNLSIEVVEFITAIEFNDLGSRGNNVVACSRAQAKRSENSVVTEVSFSRRDRNEDGKKSSKD